METTSWAVWSLRWAKWPARQPAGVSTGRWFDMTTLQSDGGAGKDWPQVSVCCQSSSNITGRSQSNDTAAFSCNFVFTLGFWSPHQRTVAVGPFGQDLCSYLLSFFQTQNEMRLRWVNHSSINNKLIRDGKCLSTEPVLWEFSHRLHPQTKAHHSKAGTSWRALIQQLKCNS